MPPKKTPATKKQPSAKPSAKRVKMTEEDDDDELDMGEDGQIATKSTAAQASKVSERAKSVPKRKRKVVPTVTSGDFVEDSEAINKLIQGLDAKNDPTQKENKGSDSESGQTSSDGDEGKGSQEEEKQEDSDSDSSDPEEETKVQTKNKSAKTKT